tara:strand:+ start:159 stop:878 length:720 start_codon:yes stop_codon:yes gene_type:complete
MRRKLDFNISEFLSNKKLKFEKKYLREKRLDFLKNLILKRKRLRVLEFGTGISTLIISRSLFINKLKYEKLTKDFRGKNYLCFSLDNNKKYLKLSKKNIKFLKLDNICKLLFVNLKMEVYKGDIVASCNRLPNMNPDLIYLDGPDQSKIKGNYKNINFSDNSFTPIQSDILKIESFLVPGTIILIDGRTNNALYFKKKLYRKWKYKYIKLYDQHLFELKDKPLGKYNKTILNFYKSKKN